MSVQFGQFEAFITAILPANTQGDIKKALRRFSLHEIHDFGICVADLKSEDCVGSDLCKSSGNPFPLRFKTLEEAQRAVDFLVELHARTVAKDAE